MRTNLHNTQADIFRALTPNLNAEDNVNSFLWFYNQNVNQIFQSRTRIYNTVISRWSHRVWTRISAGVEHSSKRAAVEREIRKGRFRDDYFHSWRIKAPRGAFRTPGGERPGSPSTSSRANPCIMERSSRGSSIVRGSPPFRLFAPVLHSAGWAHHHYHRRRAVSILPWPSTHLPLFDPSTSSNAEDIISSTDSRSPGCLMHLHHECSPPQHASVTLMDTFHHVVTQRY